AAAAPALECGLCHKAHETSAKASKHAALPCTFCHPGAEEHQAQPMAVRPKVDYRLEACGMCHSRQLQTYLKDDGKQAGPFGGSVKRSKHEEIPLFTKLHAGNAFAKDYQEERAHRYILKDHMETQRGKNSGCLSCKSTPVALKWGKEWNGVRLDVSADWQQVIDRIPPEMKESGVGCAHCHDPHTTRLRVSNDLVREAIAARGTNPYSGKPPVKEPVADGNTVCGQCHIEYVCGAGSDGEKRRYVPWRKVTELEAEYAAKFQNRQDWNHALTGIPLIKVQHPEMESYWGSKHDRAGATCASCHMPKETEGGQTYTSHWLTSPRKHLKAACAGCHQESEAELLTRLDQSQNMTARRLRMVEEALSEAVDALAAANAAPKKDAALIAQAQQAYQAAFVRWDWWSAENSQGFHNLDEATRDLDFALARARRARETARRALQ
ncbi:MAG: ammonia-forming cytochrome c nitrite reductase subunit c552, partial [Armatimonadota bacterium]|nr:ammonia-forming cytochrome c nitrite reductase subunit c552 [Armatimonadota bacterium]